MLQFGANACASLISPGNNTVTWLQCGEAQFDLCLIRQFYFESYNLPSKIGWLGIEPSFQAWCQWRVLLVQRSSERSTDVTDSCGRDVRLRLLWWSMECLWLPGWRKTVHISKSLKLSAIKKAKNKIFCHYKWSHISIKLFLCTVWLLQEHILMQLMTI